MTTLCDHHQTVIVNLARLVHVGDDMAERITEQIRRQCRECV